MPKASVKRLIECKKEQLIDLVLDIEKYPIFVPFCLDSKIYEKKDNGDILLIVADLTIGKGPLKDTYKSDVKFNMNDDMKKDTEFLRQNYGAKTAQEVIADNINNYDDNDGNSNKDNEKEDDGREGGLAKKQRQETALLKEDSPTEE